MSMYVHTHININIYTCVYACTHMKRAQMATSFAITEFDCLSCMYIHFDIYVYLDTYIHTYEFLYLCICMYTHEESAKGNEIAKKISCWSSWYVPFWSSWYIQSSWYMHITYFTFNTCTGVTKGVDMCAINTCRYVCHDTLTLAMLSCCVWYDMLCCCVWYDMLSCCVWYDMLSCCVWYDMLCCYVWYDMLCCYVWFDSFRGRQRRQAFQPDGLLEGLVDVPLLLSGLWPGVEMCFSALQYVAGRCSGVYNAAMCCNVLQCAVVRCSTERSGCSPQKNPGLFRGDEDGRIEYRDLRQDTPTLCNTVEHTRI